MNNFLKLLSLIFLVFPLISKGEPNIMPSSIKQDNRFQLASNFLEHYVHLLESPRTEEVKDSIRRIKEDGFQYIIGNDKQLVNLKGTEDFSISINNENYQYITEWSENGKTLVKCSFPANIYLLTSSNKIELENNMIRRLNEVKYKSTGIKLPKVEKSILQKVSLSNFYVADHGFYITPRLKNQITYEIDTENPDSCLMLIDTEKYQLESLSNMLLTGYSRNPQNMKVKVSQYGYKHQTIEVPLSNLFELLTEEGCIPYWGVDKYNGKVVNGVYLWINLYGGYAHLMTLESPIDAIDITSNHLVKLHCYLRLDNLKSLFEEYI